MKYILTNVLMGTSVEIVFGEKVVLLTPSKPSITLTEEEFKSFSPTKKYLFENGYVKVEEVKEEKKEKKEVKN